MPSRRILSNNNLAPIQEAAVNPYDSFNSDVINKLTRIVSGGKDSDVIVDGLDVSSNDEKTWLATTNLLSTFTNRNQFLDNGWLPSSDDEVYIGQYITGDSTTYIDLCIPHEKSYGFSYIQCKLPIDKLVYYFGKNKERDFEVSFKLKRGTPKSIVASINSSKAVLDHPEPRDTEYTLRINRNFIRDNKEDGLVFRIGAVLDGADPSEDLVKESNNKTYIRIYDIQVKLYGYSREPFPRAIGPVNGVYGLSGIHPVKTLKVTPGLAIKDDAMLEELGIDKYDKDKVVELDPTQDSSWIKGGKYTVNEFFGGKNPTQQTQYAFQLNNTSTGYTRHNGSFTSDGHLKINVNGTTFDPIDDLEVVSNDTKITFSDYTEDEDNNVIFYYTGKATISNGGNICLLCYKNTNGDTVVAEIKNKLTTTNGKLDNFDIELKSDKFTGRVQSVNDFFGYITNGPIKVSGDPQLYNTELVKWAYVVVYYSYFKNPVPNVSYVGLVREEDLNDVKFREDYLILAKVRFIDPYTIDIISYENRQRKWLPRSDKINYSTTCNFPEIWYDEVPDTVTDAIDYLAKFNVNLARLIRYKHDYDAEISSAFSLITEHEIPTGSDKDKKPYIRINDYSHLERRIRVNTDVLTVTSVYNGNTILLNKEFTKTTIRDGKIIYVNNSIDNKPWAITFEQSVIDNRKEYEYFSLGGEVLVKVSMGPYDSTTGTITNRYICFNTIGPFRFLDKDTGNEAVKVDWTYSDVLLYPTSPSMDKSEEGKFTDVDDGGWKTGYYGGTHTNSGNYLLSYTTADGSTVTSLNNDKNHFHFVKFRNDLLTNDRFLKLLDMMPRDPEVLFNKRVLEGQKSSNANDQVHIQSSQHQLDDDMVDYNLTMSVRDNTKPIAKDINGVTKTADTVTNHIKSSKFTIAGANPADQNEAEKTAGMFNRDLKDTALLTSLDISTNQDKSKIKIKSTDMHLAATGGNKILVSNYNNDTKLYDVISSDYTAGDFFKYWFKPKFSYNTESKKLRIVIDGAKNYITRVSDIISEFNKEPASTSVTITSAKVNGNSITYKYNGNSISAGMLVYTEGDATTPYYCNTIGTDINHFAKVSSGSSQSSVTIFDNPYQFKDTVYTNDTYLYIEPVNAGQIFCPITAVSKSGNILTITVGNPEIDDFKIKERMGVYTTGLSFDIYRYNNFIIKSIDGNKITVETNTSYSGSSASSITVGSNSKIYFISDENSNGLYPKFIIDRVDNVSDGVVKFHVSGVKYFENVTAGNNVFITNSDNSIYNVDEEDPLTITNIENNSNGDLEWITISGYDPEIVQDSTEQQTISATGFVISEVAGVFNDHVNKLLSFPVLEVKKTDSTKFTIKIAKLSTTRGDYPLVGKSTAEIANLIGSFKLDDIEYDSTLTSGIIFSTSTYSMDNPFTISSISNTGYEQFFSEVGSSTLYINYTTIDVTWSSDIQDSDLALIDGNYYAYYYVPNKTGTESWNLCDFAYRYKISRVQNGNYIVNDNISTQLNDGIIYTDDLGTPIRYSDEIGSNNPQLVESASNGSFTVSKQNGYDSTFNNTLKANARNVTLSEIVSAAASENNARISAEVLIDITNIKDISIQETTRDTFTILEKYFKSKLVVVNDLIDKIDSSTNLPVKPYISLSFGILDGDEIINDANYTSNPTRIIWKDEYRGYNNTKEEEEEFSKMLLYPAQVVTNAVGGNNALVDITKEFNPSGSTVDKLSGYGYCRGPIYDIKAGIRSEFDFQYLNTQSKIRVDGDTIYLDDKDISKISLDGSTKLTDVLSLKDIPDLIFAKSSMYYIGNTASVDTGTTIQIGYNPNGGTLNGKTSIQYTTISNPTSSSKYPNIVNSIVAPSKRRFSGWYYNNTKINLGTTKLQKLTSHNIVAKYNYDVINVTFIDTNTGTDKNPNTTRNMTYININTNNWNTLSNLTNGSGAAAGTSIVGMPDWTRDGYSLQWSYHSNGDNVALSTDSYTDNGYKPYVTSSNTLTIYAVWTTASLTVTAQPNGGKWSDGTSNDKSFTYDYNAIYGKLDRSLTRIGYDFIGWKNFDSGDMISDADSVGTISHKIEAQWNPKILVNMFFKNNNVCNQSNPNPQLVKYASTYGTSVVNDGRFDSYPPSIYGNAWNTGSLPSLSNFTSDDGTIYEFNGWYKTPQGTDKVTDSTTVTIPFSHPLFAKWGVIEPEDPEEPDPQPNPVSDTKYTIYEVWDPTNDGSMVHKTSSGSLVRCNPYTSNNISLKYQQNGQYYYYIKIAPGRNMLGISKCVSTSDETVNNRWIDKTNVPVCHRVNYRFIGWKGSDVTATVQNEPWETCNIPAASPRNSDYNYVWAYIDVRNCKTMQNGDIYCYFEAQYSST